MAIIGGVRGIPGRIGRADEAALLIVGTTSRLTQRVGLGEQTTRWIVLKGCDRADRISDARASAQGIIRRDQAVTERILTLGESLSNFLCKCGFG